MVFALSCQNKIMRKFRLYTLGCKVNQYESQAIREEFISSGFSEAAVNKPADVYVINSCTVTSRAKPKSLELARKRNKETPKAIIVLTGCLVNGGEKDFPHKIQADFM